MFFSILFNDMRRISSHLKSPLNWQKTRAVLVILVAAALIWFFRRKQRFRVTENVDVLNRKPKYFPDLWELKYQRPSTILCTLNGESILVEPSQPFANGKRIMEFIRTNTIWQKRGRNHLVAWYTERPCTCEYEYDKGNAQPSRKMSDWMKELRDHMMLKLTIPPDNPPNSVNMNWYKNGKAGISAHSDNEELFLGLYKPAKIVSFTLGAERVFEIWSYNFRKKIKELVLPNGSYMTMETMFQRHYRHSIPLVEKELPPRLNMTWRYIKMHTASCPCACNNPARKHAFNTE